PAIVWQDRRTEPICAQLRAQGLEVQITAKTGLLLDPYFSGTKLAWLLDHLPGARQRAQRGELAFGTIDAWLIWKLTGGAVHATDVSNASRTLLFNLHTLQWDEDLLRWLNVPREVLPQVVLSSGVAGHTSASLLGAAVPIAGVAGDQQAATFGQACFQPGMAKNTYGTGCFLMMHAGASAPHSSNHLLATVGWQRSVSAPATYLLEGSVFMGGALVQWLRDGLGLIAQASEIENLARQCEDSAGLTLVPAFTGLGAPYWDASARGLLIGLTRGSTAAHIARAALEAIAHQCADVLEAMHRDTTAALTELRVDGGAARNDMLMQLQADLIGVPVVRPSITETTALGAAYLAGLGVGLWASEQDIASLWRADRIFEPALSLAKRQAARAQWSRAIERTKNWATAEALT
nr:glycerol kinase [Burkholderiaceae bacterium]